MFDQLVESTNKKTTHKVWTVWVSALIQALILGVLILIPLIYTSALPKALLTTFLVAPPPPPPPPPPAVKVIVKPEPKFIQQGKLVAPTVIPKKIQMIKEEAQPDVGMTGGVPGGVPGGSAGGVLGGIIGGAPGGLPPPPKPVEQIRVGGNVMQAALIRQVQPIYPQIAKTAHISGTVVLHAIIAKDGTVQELQFISGPPLLMRAAMDAVKQWRYRPTLLNGQAVKVDTTVTVIFNLGD
ncbi:MAG: energy transducer TonB [Candidatus Acidiferrales bacterium]